MLLDRLPWDPPHPPDSERLQRAGSDHGADGPVGAPPALGEFGRPQRAVHGLALRSSPPRAETPQPTPSVRRSDSAAAPLRPRRLVPCALVAQGGAKGRASGSVSPRRVKSCGAPVIEGRSAVVKGQCLDASCIAFTAFSLNFSGPMLLARLR